MDKTTRRSATSSSGRSGAAKQAHAATTTARGAAKAGKTTAKPVKVAETTVRQGTNIGAARGSQIGKIPVIRAHSPAQTAVDLVVELPGGTAHITIQAKAGVRRAAEDWLRAVEALARTSLSAWGAVRGLLLVRFPRPLARTRRAGLPATGSPRCLPFRRGWVLFRGWGSCCRGTGIG